MRIDLTQWRAQHPQGDEESIFEYNTRLVRLARASMIHEAKISMDAVKKANILTQVLEDILERRFV